MQVERLGKTGDEAVLLANPWIRAAASVLAFEFQAATLLPLIPGVSEESEMLGVLRAFVTPVPGMAGVGDAALWCAWIAIRCALVYSLANQVDPSSTSGSEWTMALTSSGWIALRPPPSFSARSA